MPLSAFFLFSGNRNFAKQITSKSYKFVLANIAKLTGSFRQEEETCQLFGRQELSIILGFSSKSSWHPKPPLGLEGVCRHWLPVLQPEIGGPLQCSMYGSTTLQGSVNFWL
jgi:hypothetical protein